jgi:polysaccharide biosynthesis protein PelG
MAGIGFALRRLAQQDTLGAGLRAHVYAAALCCGPWIFTVVALAVAGLFSSHFLTPEEQPRFSVIIIYNFAFSMVLSGPLVLVVTRYLADRIYARDVSGIPGTLLGALVVLYAVLASVGIPFFGWIADLTAPERLFACINLLVIGGIWVASAFLSATKSFAAISAAFGVGTAIALLLSGPLGASFGAVGILAAFTTGFAFILYALIACVLAHYPDRIMRPFAFVPAFRKYWEYAFAGLFYNAGVWVDKWILWLSPDRTIFVGGMPVNPAYDASMFLAFLAIIPAMTLFLVAIETRFFELYLRFYRDIAGHATLTEIRERHQALMRVLAESSRNVAVLQTVICYLAIVMAPVIIDLLGGGLEMVPIFRFGLLGALFHALLLFALVIISYFDLRRLLLSVSVLFFASNALLTWATVLLGPAYYGYGYFLAALISAVYAYSAAARTISQLPYVTFVVNNRGLRGSA